MFELIIKKSKFLAYSFDIETKEEAELIIKEYKNRYDDANHVVYAYKTNNNGGMSDDGEPKGTAGKPIFKLIEFKKMTNKLIIVIRYFGGKKLGAGQLIRAYVKSAKNVI